MKAKKNSTARQLCPQGTHVILLVAILDYGTQTDKFGSREKVELIFETPDEKYEDADGNEHPYLVDRKVGLTIGKGSVLKDIIEALTGEKVTSDEFDLEGLLGKACQGNIKQSKNGEYTDVEIDGFLPLAKNDSKRKFKAENEMLIIDLSSDKFDLDSWNTLLTTNHLKWRAKYIMESPQFKELATEFDIPTEVASEEAEEEEEKPAPKKAPAKKAATPPPAKKPAGKLLGKR
jgi:hypothetical protein